MGNVLALIRQVWLDYKVGRDLRINSLAARDSATTDKEAEDQNCDEPTTPSTKKKVEDQVHEEPTTTSSCAEEPGLTNETQPDHEITHHQPEQQHDVPKAAIESKKEAEEQVPNDPTSTSSDCEEPESTPGKRSSTEITTPQQERHVTPKATTAPRKKEKQSGWRRSRDPNAEFPWRGEFFIDGESTWRETWVLEVKDLEALDWETEKVPKWTGGYKYVRKMTRHWPFPPPGQRGKPLGGGQDNLMAFLGRP